MQPTYFHKSLSFNGMKIFKEYEFEFNLINEPENTLYQFQPFLYETVNLINMLKSERLNSLFSFSSKEFQKF